jgi:hypothetical protein
MWFFLRKIFMRKVFCVSYILTNIVFINNTQSIESSEHLYLRVVPDDYVRAAHRVNKTTRKLRYFVLEHNTSFAAYVAKNWRGFKEINYERTLRELDECLIPERPYSILEDLSGNLIPEKLTRPHSIPIEIPYFRLPRIFGYDPMRDLKRLLNERHQAFEEFQHVRERIIQRNCDYIRIGVNCCLMLSLIYYVSRTS